MLGFISAIIKYFASKILVSTYYVGMCNSQVVLKHRVSQLLLLASLCIVNSSKVLMACH